jgi:hypothetical protein
MTGQVIALHPSKTIADAAEAFLQRDMADTTRRSYTQTINRLAAKHSTLALEALDGATLDTFTAAAWGQCAPATWNRHVATLRSFTAFARRRGWLTTDPASVLERRTEPADRTRAIAAASLERLFRREDVTVREKCLWRLEHLLDVVVLGSPVGLGAVRARIDCPRVDPEAGCESRRQSQVRSRPPRIPGRFTFRSCRRQMRALGASHERGAEVSEDGSVWVGRASVFVWGWGVPSLYVEVGEKFGDAGWQPPCGAAEEGHRGGHEGHANYECVDEDAEREAEAERLGGGVGGQDERCEHGDHDDPG